MADRRWGWWVRAWPAEPVEVLVVRTPMEWLQVEVLFQEEEGEP
jgi:hypothetical protein